MRFCFVLLTFFLYRFCVLLNKAERLTRDRLSGRKYPQKIDKLRDKELPDTEFSF